MITEDYVSFETAKLLKENGFNEGCHSVWLYNPKEDNSEYFVEYLVKGVENNTELEQFNEPDTDWAYSAPTHQMALKWLREVHNIFIFIDYVIFTKLSFKYTYEIHYIINRRIMEVSAFRDDYETYEEAVEAALKYCLTNLIK